MINRKMRPSHVGSAFRESTISSDSALKKLVAEKKMQEDTIGNAFVTLTRDQEQILAKLTKNKRI